MKAVIGAASTGRFPRWGYLDRYTTNEYMPRALSVAVALTILGIGVLQLWRTLPPDVTMHIVERPLPRFADPTDVLPPPTFPVPRTFTVPKPAVRPPISIPVPVPDPGIEREWNAAPGSATGLENTPGTDDTAETGPITEGGEIVSAWPSPDDIIVVEKEPELVMMQSPAYPEIAREAGLQGTVLVRVLVDTAGAVRDVQVLESVLGFEEAAVTAARTAVFRPAMQQDRPVAVWVVIPIEFRLR